jgi:acetylornithine deacetylase/succinyl-diaminopimelate desuccinylase-like protein
MKKNPDLRVELEVTHCQKVPGHVWDRITEDDPLVQEILEFSREFTGRQDLKMEWGGSHGGGRPDLWNVGSIVIFSGGLPIPRGGHGAHSPDEFVRVDGLVPSTQIMVDFVQKVLENGISPPRK